MTDKDGILKIFFEDNTNAADIINLSFFDGEPLVSPKDLSSAETEEIEWLDGMQSQDDHLLKSYRDVCRHLSRKTDGEREYLIIGIENQSELDYGMVGRVLVENVMNYARQMRKFRREHRENVISGVESQVNSREYLSGMYSTDRLKPVVTTVIYWGSKPWNGPLSFRDLLAKCEPRIMDYQPDFHMPILIPSNIPEAKLDCVSKNMKLVLKYAGASMNKALLKRRLASDPDFCNVPPIVTEVLKKVVGVHFSENTNEKGELNMCYAQEQLEKDAEERGLKLGEERGLKLGEERGLKLGEERGLKLGEERGLKLGEERGLKLGEERGLKLGEERGEKQARRKAIESLVHYEKRQGLSQEELCRKVMAIFLMDWDEAFQYVAGKN